MRFAAVERRNFVTTTERVANLVRPDKSGTAQNQNAQWLHCFLREQRCRSCTNRKRARYRKFNEFPTGLLHCAIIVGVSSERNAWLETRAAMPLMMSQGAKINSKKSDGSHA